MLEIPRDHSDIEKIEAIKSARDNHARAIDGNNCASLEATKDRFEFATRRSHSEHP